ncbi:PLD nuclease N-terminal domain-containing protein [Microbacterium sp. cf332]|uniref:PLD nuclease N-terminal domain-containing protein n=1 Tax=Microbacterium sp. cf332 TaxID=1761804 RepID=UPI000884B234|nr:PLD nuclease N-terminal domain-containing protein [Microbacterium sp. cf332]SDQ43927.1 Phospholipase_D-nuclease N-terminal [Microbacterium sp. cf332]
MYVLLPLLVLVLMVAALVDAITRRDDQVKHLPKFAWVLFIVFLPFIGSVLWFTLGREWDASPKESMSFGDPRRWSRDDAGPASPAGRPAPRDYRTTAQQLADLEREIEIAELEAELRRRRAVDPQSPDAG